MFVAKCNAGSLGLVGGQVVFVADAKQKSVMAVDARQVGNRSSDQSEIGVQLKTNTSY